MTNTGDNIQKKNGEWTFSDGVSKTFDRHILRSVPLYREGHKLVTQLSDFFLSDGSICYELGCSTGTLMHSIAQRNQHKNVKFVGVDCEPDMIAECENKYGSVEGMQWIVANVLDLKMEKSDLIIAYYTVQFISPKNRQILIDRIFEALNWGGAFLLFEKVRAPDARFQDIATAMYNDYKIEKGYKPEEIMAKARSLKGVLEPFSTQGNLDLLKRAGFNDIMTVMKYICFEGFLAIK